MSYITYSPDHERILRCGSRILNTVEMSGTKEDIDGLALKWMLAENEVIWLEFKTF
jgi:hypothetical protein